MPPTLDSDILARPRGANISVALEPAQNVVSSMLLLNAAEQTSGLDDWVTRTAAQLGLAQLHRNRLVFEGLYYAIQPDRSWPSFSMYLDHLAAQDAIVLRDRLLQQLCRACATETPAGAEAAQLAEPQSLLSSVDAYIGFLQANFFEIDVGIETEAYSFFVDPPRMKELIVSHIRALWQEHLAAEWERVKPIVQESVAAFQRVDFRRMSGFDALRFVTGQEPREKWEHMIAGARQITFVPSAHLGPYLHKFKEDQRLWVLFGARLPDGAQSGDSVLGRAELLMRLGALTDDTRLRMLVLLAQHEELCAQDVMQQLDLSQSAASRHLRQLSAAGYLVERRRDTAKCYSLNRERIQSTFQALDRMLKLNS